jgi:hypothetical protein
MYGKSPEQSAADYRLLLPHTCCCRSRAARLVFTALRLWARVLLYVSSLLSIVSGAVSFTVVPAIALSMLSAAAQVGAGQVGAWAQELAAGFGLKEPRLCCQHVHTAMRFAPPPKHTPRHLPPIVAATSSPPTYTPTTQAAALSPPPSDICAERLLGCRLRRAAGDEGAGLGGGGDVPGNKTGAAGSPVGGRRCGWLGRASLIRWVAVVS